MKGGHMKITDLLSSKTIDINAAASSKSDCIEKAVALISKSGVIDDLETYKKGVYHREEESTTGIGEGIAIPHCKSDVVKKPALAAMVLKDGVDYDSLDGEKVNLLFLIAAPNTEDNVHLEVLARLSNLLMDENFKNDLIGAKSTEEFLSIIDKTEEARIQEEKKDEAPKNEYPEILGVTGCPNGIAHTYMAEEALKKKAEEMGYTCKVETNGSGGIKNLLTDEEIEHAKGIVVAADVNVEMSRFDGRRVVISTVSKGIHEPENLIKEAVSGEAPIYHSENKETKKEDKATSGSIIHQFYKHLMNGVSHMLPFVIGGGILIAIAFMIDTFAGVPTDSNFGTGTPVSWFLKTTGGIAFNFMLPVFAAFIAYSIAGRPGLAVGFVGGSLATISSYSIEVQITKNDTGSTAGFLGALIAGFLAGYIIKLLEKATSKFPKSLDGVKPMLIYPVFGIVLIGLVMFLLNTPFTYINIGITNALNWLGNHQLTILLGALLAAMMAVDMGGPINKAAYVFGTAMLTQAAASSDPATQSYCYQMMAAVMIGGMVPPLGIALSATLFPQKWSKQERKEAMVNYIMGAGFITEGAIPYAAKDPLRVISSSVVGSAVAGLLSVVFKCTLMAPHGGIFVFAVVGNWYWYLLSLAIGTVITAFMLSLLKKDDPNPELGKFKGISFKRRK